MGSDDFIYLMFPYLFHTEENNVQDAQGSKSWRSLWEQKQQEQQGSELLLRWKVFSEKCYKILTFRRINSYAHSSLWGRKQSKLSLPYPQQGNCNLWSTSSFQYWLRKSKCNCSFALHFAPITGNSIYRAKQWVGVFSPLSCHSKSYSWPQETQNPPQSCSRDRCSISHVFLTKGKCLLKILQKSSDIFQ